MTETRKRRHLVDDDNYSIQTKYYVNSKMVEKSDMNLMKNVYGKSQLGLKTKYCILCCLNITNTYYV